MIGLDANCFFCCFAPTQSKIDGVVGKPCFSNPFRNSLSFPKRFNKACVSSVLGLLRSISPHAVFGAVPLIVVNSFNAKPFWALTHIRQEILKVHPLGANSYSPATIILVGFASLANASFFNSLPYLVGRSTFSTQSVSM